MPLAQSTNFELQAFDNNFKFISQAGTAKRFFKSVRVTQYTISWKGIQFMKRNPTPFWLKTGCLENGPIDFPQSCF